MLAFFFGSSLAMYFNLLGAIVVMTQTAWPIIVILLPLSYVYFSYQVTSTISFLLTMTIGSFCFVRENWWMVAKNVYAVILNRPTI